MLVENGTAREVPAASLRIGDLVLVRPGDRVSADGEVAEGESEVDESPVTGESVPVSKAEGALVFAGVPIAFAFGLATFGYLAVTTSLPTLVLIGRMDEGMSHLVLLAVPLFVFLGLLIEATGMTAVMDQMLTTMRPNLVQALRQQAPRVSPADVDRAVDEVLMPEFRARLPELTSSIAGIYTRNFTVAELRGTTVPVTVMTLSTRRLSAVSNPAVPKGSTHWVMP